MTSPFEIEGPDDEGNVWLRAEAYTRHGTEILSTNLGPKDQVAEVFSQWLETLGGSVGTRG